jgi:hypothetical protein
MPKRLHRHCNTSAGHRPIPSAPRRTRIARRHRDAVVGPRTQPLSGKQRCELLASVRCVSRQFGGVQYSAVENHFYDPGTAVGKGAAAARVDPGVRRKSSIRQRVLSRPSFGPCP